MRKRVAQLLSICLLMLSGNVLGMAREIQPGVQEKSPGAAQEPSAAEQEKAAAKAAAEQNRAAAKAAAEQKRAAAKALAKEKRTLSEEKRAAEREKRSLQNEKRKLANEKRTAAHAAAQQKRTVERAIRQATRPEGTFKLLGSRLGFGKLVKGAPYSATAITEHTQTLSDGNQIIQKNEATYYRDSEGRTRIDRKLKTIGKWSASGDPPQIITIFDPVVGNHYSLDPRTRTALVDVRGPQKIQNPKPNPTPAPMPKPNSLNGPKEITGPTGLRGPKQITRPKEGSAREKQKQSLGTRVIEGVSAEGTRSTVTIPAGEIGNVRPIDIVDESWYSSELQVPVMTSHHDPRSGDTIYRLTNINRNEPARSLFEVPADYRIVDRRAPKPPRTPELPKIAEPAKKPEDKF